MIYAVGCTHLSRVSPSLQLNIVGDDLSLCLWNTPGVCQTFIDWKTLRPPPPPSCHLVDWKQEGRVKTLAEVKEKKTGPHLWTSLPGGLSTTTFWTSCPPWLPEREEESGMGVS